MERTPCSNGYFYFPIEMEGLVYKPGHGISIFLSSKGICRFGVTAGKRRL